MTNDTIQSTSSSASGPRDVFSHLLSIVWLYVSVFTLGMLLFSLIEVWFPDITAPYWMPYTAQQGTIRWIVAVLTVVFPLYVYTVFRLEKDTSAHPEKRMLKTRRWGYNFTLFLTSIVIAIDVITALYTFLNGELTTRFICKVASVLLIAAAVFVYYRWSLRTTLSLKESPRMKYFSLSVVAVVIALIITGYFYAGSPKAERLRRIDDERVSHLQSIQGQIVSHWQTKGSLPTNLTALADDISGWSAPTDPVTSQSYEYKKLGDRSFELCAVFDTSSMNGSSLQPEKSYPFFEENWQHGIGRSCFSRTVDPDRYPILPKPAVAPLR